MQRIICIIARVGNAKNAKCTERTQKIARNGKWKMQIRKYAN